ncbi:MAG: MlaD family protein [Fibromonadaceae bacterium]|jgi:ABC-type transporter Mla subunit MlaD|nr:MlaD family protein [Fibromonadaceae bacterium]
MNNEKLIGSLTIAALLLVIAYIAFSIWQSERRARNVVLVQFPEMGALQNGDVVAIRGFAIGHIVSITKANDKALVEISLDEPRIFRKDTRFRNVSPNIMGSRSIVVEPGKNGEPMPKDYVFDGEFEPGFAEILALTDIARKQVAALMELVRMLHTGDDKNPSLQKKVEDIMDECEGVLDALSKVINTVENQTMGALNKVGDYAELISDASSKIDKSLDTIRVQAKDGVESANKVILSVMEAIENLNKIIIQFESSPVTVALLDKKEVLNDIDSLRSSLQAFVSKIDSKGIKIYDENGKRKNMVSLKNIHLIRETARSKAKKRALEGK